MNTIREQIEEQIKYTISWSADDIENIKESTKACEAIVEDIAIQFAEFYADNMFADKYEHMSIKELYQLFKEENKL